MLFLGTRSAVDAHRVALDAVKRAGFAVTEISHPGLLSLPDAPRVRRHAEEIGLAIHAVHAPPMRRDPTLARQRAAAALAAELGATILVVHASSIRFASPDPAVRAAARERDLHRLAALLHACANLGISLGLENGTRPGHDEYLLNLVSSLEGAPGRGKWNTAPPIPTLTSTPTPTHARAPAHPLTPTPPHLLTPSPPAGLVFDSGHAALRWGDPLAVARAMLPRLIHTHLHDNHGARDEHLVPGDGRIDWPALLGLLREGGYAGTRLLELRPRPGYGPEQWEREMVRAWAKLSEE